MSFENKAAGSSIPSAALILNDEHHCNNIDSELKAALVNAAIEEYISISDADLIIELQGLGEA